MDKYEKLFSLAQSNWSEFTVVTDQIPADNLDYERLLGFLESYDSRVRDGARMLLMKHFPDNLDYEQLLGFLESYDSRVRDGARMLLMKHFPDKCPSTKGKDILALFLK